MSFAIMFMVTDCRGARLYVGSKVAYNRSGEVQPGEIAKIYPKWRKVTWGNGHQWDGSFRVVNALDGKTSVVKNHTSLMVLP